MKIDHKALIVRILLDGPTTVPKLTQATGAHWQTVLRFVNSLEKAEAVYVDKSRKPYVISLYESTPND